MYRPHHHGVCERQQTTILNPSERKCSVLSDLGARKKESHWAIHWFISNSVRMPSKLMQRKQHHPENTQRKARKKGEKLFKMEWKLVRDFRHSPTLFSSDNGFDLFWGWIRKLNDNSFEIIGWTKADRGRKESEQKLKTKRNILKDWFNFSFDFSIARKAIFLLSTIMARMMFGIECKKKYNTLVSGEGFWLMVRRVNKYGLSSPVHTRKDVSHQSFLQL